VGRNKDSRGNCTCSEKSPTNSLHRKGGRGDGRLHYRILEEGSYIEKNKFRGGGGETRKAKRTKVVKKVGGKGTLHENQDKHNCGTGR